MSLTSPVLLLLLNTRRKEANDRRSFIFRYEVSLATEPHAQYSNETAESLSITPSDTLNRLRNSGRRRPERSIKLRSDAGLLVPGGNHNLISSLSLSTLFARIASVLIRLRIRELYSIRWMIEEEARSWP